MNEHSNRHSEKRNLRPYILGACFIWGLTLGFFTYLKTDSAAKNQQDQQKILDKKLAADATNKVKKPLRKAEPMRTTTTRETPKIDPGPIDHEPDTEGENTQEPPLRNIPEMAVASVNTSWGLTGRSTYRPVKPVKLEKKAPTVDFSRKDKKSTAPVNLNEIEPPELEE